MVAKLGLRKMTERRAVSGLGNDTDQAAGGLTKGGLFDGKHNKGIFDLLWHRLLGLLPHPNPRAILCQA